VGKLESTISELEEELQEQQAEASDAVEQWSARWSELDAIKSQLETKLEALTSERDDLAESLQREKENGGREKVDQIERERNIERGEWNAEKELMQARIDDQNESLLVSSQNITELETALESLQEQSAGVVDEWKGKSN
jgi:chromosome segregation ATPase